VFKEDDLLPLSALQHFLFCERQCALIHIEGQWADNRLTVEGTHQHKKAHDGPAEMRRGVRTTRGMAVRSFRLGLTGKADVVEFERLTGGGAAPFPVEYKRGRPKTHDADPVQLCAQALCLEEMLGVSVPKGALFYGQVRRRLEVVFSSELRALTEETARRLHELIAAGRTPSAFREPKCDSCSLVELCLPASMSGSAGKYLVSAITAAIEEGAEPRL
jgi:CRISPR-associated exonuclease Cas4